MGHNYRNIILSGPPGPGKTTLTNKLHEITGYEIRYIGGLFRERHAEAVKLGKTDLPFEKWWNQLSKQDQIEVNNWAKLWAEEGEKIIDTRFAKICENTGSLHVFLYAPLSIRAQRAVGDEKYPNKSAKEIEVILREREEAEAKWCKELFGFDHRNFDDYHLMLNTNHLSVSREVRTIMSLMKYAP
ncbi:MAG: cytidylate kinase family protein [Nanoarchaeota archaeon]